MSLQDALIGLVGGSSADADTVNLLEQVVTNISNGKTGNPTIPFPSFLGGTQQADGSTGLGISVLNPYLRVYLYQQEYPYAFPIAVVGIGFLSIYGLVKLLRL